MQGVNNISESFLCADVSTNISCMENLACNPVSIIIIINVFLIRIHGIFMRKLDKHVEDRQGAQGGKSPEEKVAWMDNAMTDIILKIQSMIVS